MARKKHNIHYLYKTICDITGKYYIGMHSTNNENDGYMGSGLRLRRSIRKYGVDNHTKEILEYFDTKEQLIEAEKEVITPEMIADENCMNLKEGGVGGCSSKEHKLSFSKGGIKSRKLLWETNQEWVKNFCVKASEGNKKAYERGNRERKVNYDWNGKNHSEETKQLLSEKAKLRTSEQNSQYGTCWITKDGENKKIKKEGLIDWLKEGWVKGRKL